MPMHHLFGSFSPEKLEKVIRPHAREEEEPRCQGITFSALQPILAITEHCSLLPGML